MTSTDRRRLHAAYLAELMGTDTVAGVQRIEDRYTKALALTESGLIAVFEALNMIRGMRT